MAAFESLEAAIPYLGKECVVISTGEHGLLCSIQAEGSKLECPFGFYREMSDVEPFEDAAPTLESIEVTLDPASIAVDGTSSLSATGTYSDGSTAALPDAEFSSGTEAVATVAGDTATGVSAGTSVITATFGGKTGTATLTVTA